MQFNYEYRSPRRWLSLMVYCKKYSNPEMIIEKNISYIRNICFCRYLFLRGGQEVMCGPFFIGHVQLVVCGFKSNVCVFVLFPFF